jgi:predicted ATPase
VLALGAKRRADETTIDALVRRIGHQGTLVVLDQCALAPVPCAALAAALLPACPALRILAINVEPFGIEGELSLAVPALGAPMPEDAGTEQARGRFEAGKLFMERAAQIGKRIEGEDAAHVARACARVRGWPLAVELAAAMTQTMEPAALDAALEQRLMLSPVTSPDRITRLMVEWAYDQLSSVDRGLLHRIAMFSGWCSPRALAAVSGAPDSYPDPTSDSISGGPITAAEAKVHELATKLAQRGLVRLRPSKSSDALGARYRVHEAARAYARELMQAAGAAPLGRRLATYSLRLLEQAVPRLNSPGRSGWLARLESEHGAIIGSMDFADEQTRGAMRELIAAWRASREF